MRTPLFVLAEIDDAGLTPSEMRVLVRVARRWSPTLGCFESAPAMAEACGLNVKTVRAALRALTVRGILVDTPRDGQTTRYDWGDPARWRTPEASRTLPNERVGDPTQSDTLPDPNPTRSAGTPLPNERVDHPTRLSTHKGIPLKAIPKGSVRAPARDENGFTPPTLDEVLAAAAVSGVAEQQATEFFLHYDSQDWRTSGHGLPHVVNWRSKLMSWKLKQAGFDRRAAGRPGGTLSPLEPVLADDLPSLLAAFPVLSREHFYQAGRDARSGQMRWQLRPEHAALAAAAP